MGHTKDIAYTSPVGGNRREGGRALQLHMWRTGGLGFVITHSCSVTSVRISPTLSVTHAHSD